jgi:hypothetical protein
MCGINAMFTLLFTLTTLAGVSLDKIFTSHLWSGRGKSKMHCNTLRTHFLLIIDLLKKNIHKCVHMARMYSAQNFYQLGISIADIAAAGDWMLNHLLRTYIIPSLSPRTLLAAAGWTHLDNFNSFWAPRFEASVPDELVAYLFPDLQRAESQAKADKNHGMLGFIGVVRFGSTVLIQDAFDSAHLFPENPVNKYLLQNQHFRSALI